MKLGQPHIVPLARQALAIPPTLQPLARSGHYLSRSLHTRERPLSDNTINAALRRRSYTRDEQTGHGFCSRASTLFSGQGYPPDVIELKLGHAERHKVRAAYSSAASSLAALALLGVLAAAQS
jgi:integrase